MDFKESEISFMGCYFPVSKNAFEKLCGEHLEVVNGGRDVKTLSPDGGDIANISTGLTKERREELRAALEGARCVPLRTKPLIQIILEEADAYFTGTKSIDEVRDIVENRVGLYLKERQ